MNKMNQATNMTCHCGDDYFHLMARLEFKDNDNYQVTSVKVDGEHKITFSSPIKYPYRSQGNLHLLFAGECGHFAAKSFDGHKGYIFLDQNPLMYELCRYLDCSIGEFQSKVDYRVLAAMERFFQIKSEAPMKPRGDLFD